MTQQPQQPYVPQQPPAGWQQPQPPAPYQPYQQPGHFPMQVRPKNPGLALLASFFVPGLGSWVVGRVGMGILIFAISFFSWVFFWLLLAFVVGVFFLIPAFAAWVWGMYDAYHGATKWNATRGIIS